LLLGASGAGPRANTAGLCAGSPTAVSWFLMAGPSGAEPRSKSAGLCAGDPVAVSWHSPSPVMMLAISKDEFGA
jgi:hypothetical protein